MSRKQGTDDSPPRQAAIRRTTIQLYAAYAAFLLLGSAAYSVVSGEIVLVLAAVIFNAWAGVLLWFAGQRQEHRVTPRSR